MSPQGRAKGEPLRPEAEGSQVNASVSALPGAPRSSSAIGLYARATAGFEARVAHTLELLRKAAVEHAGRIVQATSLGAEDMVVTDLIARHQLPITLATLRHRQAA